MTNLISKYTILSIGLIFQMVFLSCNFDKQAETATVPLIPVADFFKNPEKSAFKLSPDGDKIAFMKPWQQRMNIHVQFIGQDGEQKITSATERDIAGYMWANDNRLVYVQDKGGDENYRLYAVDADGSNNKLLTPFDGIQVRLIDPLTEQPDHMIISMNLRDKSYFDAYRIEINTGEVTLIGENPGNISGWRTDNAGKLRIATTTNGTKTGIMYRQSELQPFRLVLETDFKDMLEPLYFTFDNNHIYALSNINRDRAAIVKYDLQTNKELELIYEHPDVDVEKLLRSKKRQVITGVGYTTERRHFFFFDAERKALQETLERRLPDYEITVVSHNKNEDKYLVRTYSDRSRGAYYLFDLEEEELTHLVDVSPWIEEETMAPMQPIRFEARDGLILNGYLTLPVGLEPRNLPVVINPHGGPWARDIWGFNPEVQFLANRGYAVLQINFRGSTGYGRDFWQKGFKQWGLGMQNDLTDGANWLKEKNIADPKRIAIYGASYGGYAALAGLAFTPDLYACGVDYVGISNLFTFLKTIPPYWEQFRPMYYEMIGDPIKDKALLERVSPLLHVDKIRKPLFIAQGANDPRVSIEESNQIVEALRARGIEVPYMIKDNEGHGFQNEENRIDFYRYMEGFLAEHLGGRSGRVNKLK
jgi:dipeptidyl aminopeptidase/acylaminoacyl peptidase